MAGTMKDTGLYGRLAPDLVLPELTLAQKTLFYLFEKILPIQPQYVPPYPDALATFVLANRMD